MRRPRVRRLGVLALTLGLLGTLTPSIAPGALAATGMSIVVNSTADTAVDDGVCTLREAITAANTDTASGAAAGECAAGAGSAPDTITFSVSGTITLTGALPDITSDLEIDGAGAIAIDGANAYRPFYIASGTVTLAGLTVTKGLSPGNGGAIANDATLTVTGLTITNSSTGPFLGFSGGGIYNGSTLAVTNSTITGNTAKYGDGGGIDGAHGTVTITNSTISGNTAYLGGGGIVNDAILTITGSTISDNSATAGGGILNAGPATATVTDSTIAGNSVGNFSGGIENDGSLTLRNATITGNSAANLFGGIAAMGADVVVNTIIAGNRDRSNTDVTGTLETSTANQIGVPSGKTLGDLFVLDGSGHPKLADNGGPTKTVALALVAGNPAIDTGDSATCAAAPVGGKDQRGMSRPSACDIGAYEAQAPTVAAHATVTGTPTSGSGAVVTYTAPAGTDEQGGALTTSCTPASGSTFAIGSTTVTCTATDGFGHTGSGTFQVVLGAFVTAAPTLAPTVRPTVCECDTTALATDRSETPGLPLVLAILGLVALVALRPIARRMRR